MAMPEQSVYFQVADGRVRSCSVTYLIGRSSHAVLTIDDRLRNSSFSYLESLAPHRSTDFSLNFGGNQPISNLTFEKFGDNYLQSGPFFRINRKVANQRFQTQEA